MEVDSIIIGGGLSGMSAAARLYAHGVKSFVVLEAQNRVGGRNLAVEFEKVTFDLGGQWVGPRQPNIIRLVDELGLKLHDQFEKGKKITDYNKKMSTYSGEIPAPVGVASLVNLQLMLMWLDKYAKELDPSDPTKLNTKKAKEWDTMTVAQFVKKHGWTAGARDLIDTLVRAVLGVETHEVSFLHLLWYIRSSRGIDNLAKIKDGNQEKVIVGGAQQVSQKMSEPFKNQIVLNAAVTRIEHKPGSTGPQALVTTKDGRQFKAKRAVIIACPPAVAGLIEYSPPLGRPKQELLARNFMGSIIKCLAIYQSAFWRVAGFSGEVFSDARQGPVFNAFDDTVVNNEGDSQPAIVCFINGEAARQWSLASATNRQEAVVAQLEKWFGPKARSELKGFLEKDWTNDEYSRGCPVGNWAPGLLWPHATAMREPCGTGGIIHWAGTEVADYSQGFMDGAIQSGERAADEVMAALKVKYAPVSRVHPLG